MKNILAFSIAFSIFGVAFAQDAPLFEDSFESGDFASNIMRDGTSFEWGSTGVSISDAVARSGDYSARFIFGPNADGEDSWKELGFRFGSPVSEIRVEYWILYPENYFHRSQSGTSNNKFFQFNYNGAPKQMLTVESRGQQGSGNSAMRRFLSTTKNPDGSNNWPTTDLVTQNFIGSSEDFAIQTGRWNKVMIYYKTGSDGVRSDGRAEVWINDKLIHGLDWPFWEPDNQGRINGGYILGWSNSGFSQATPIYVDDFKIYDSAPGSSDSESFSPMPPSDFTVEN